MDNPAKKCKKCSAEPHVRRQAIPILYTRGSHYEVGFDMVSRIWIIVSHPESCYSFLCYLGSHIWLDDKKSSDSMSDSEPKPITALQHPQGQ